MCDGEPGIVEVWVDAFADLGEERAVDRPFGDIDGGGAIAAADRRHHQIAAPGKPFGGVAEFDQRKEAAVVRVERTPWFMITSGNGPSPTGRTR